MLDEDICELGEESVQHVVNGGRVNICTMILIHVAPHDVVVDVPEGHRPLVEVPEDRSQCLQPWAGMNL